MAESFALADIHALQIEGMEETPKELGYAASSEAITAKNVIAAAKDCVKRPDAPKIEAVVNALLLPLDADGLSFKPDAPITVREMATAVAKGMYGADLKIDHLKKAIDDGLFKASDITDEPITKERSARSSPSSRKRSSSPCSQLRTSTATTSPIDPPTASSEIGSVARIKTVMDEVHAVGEDNVIYVDGGDSPVQHHAGQRHLGQGLRRRAQRARSKRHRPLQPRFRLFSAKSPESARQSKLRHALGQHQVPRGKVYEGEKTYPFGDYITRHRRRPEVRHLLA